MFFRGAGGEGFITPTETNTYGEPVFFMVKTWAKHRGGKHCGAVRDNGGRACGSDSKATATA